MVDHFQTGVNFQGKLLVAHPNLTGFFSRTIILIYQDDLKNGISGLVLNKPTQVTVKQIVEDRGFGYDGTEHMYKGGPLNDQAILMIHEDQWYSGNTMQIGNGLSITSDNLMIEKMSMNNTPRQWRMSLGMAGWHPGQLQKELASKNGWLTCDASCAIVFDKDGERQWNKAVQECANQKIDSYF
ncbi:MAG: YqgE/AlgH family protein [Euryarchaeota archaeon]|jgi:putative transcriptional regulator|nr:YqgE/AlgH family protein [Euryarchaeota archaeon]